MVEMGGGQLLWEGLEACQGVVDRSLPAPCAELRSVSDGVQDVGKELPLGVHTGRGEDIRLKPLRCLPSLGS